MNNELKTTEDKHKIITEAINSYVTFRNNLNEWQRQLIMLIQMPKMSQKEICKLMEIRLSEFRKKIVGMKRLVNLEPNYKVSELVEYLQLMDKLEARFDEMEHKRKSSIIIPTNLGGGKFSYEG